MEEFSQIEAEGIFQNLCRVQLKQTSHLKIIGTMAHIQYGPTVSKHIRQTSKSHTNLRPVTNCQGAKMSCLSFVGLNWCLPTAQW